MRTPSATTPPRMCLRNADYANSADELIQVMRQQRKEGADFFKIYETGADSMRKARSFIRPTNIPRPN